MRKGSGLVWRAYAFLLRWYPLSFRREFEEQMLLDFREMARDARERGRGSLVSFYLRELLHFPFSLLQIYSRGVHTLWRFQRLPLSDGVCAAVAFGAALAFAYTLQWSIFIGLEPLAVNQVVEENVLLQAIPLLQFMGSLLSGLVLGILLAFFFGERSQYSRFLLFSVFFWFLNDVVFYAFESHRGAYFADISVGLARVFRLLTSGAYFSLIFVLLRGKRPGLAPWQMLGACAQPVFVYFYLQFDGSGLHAGLAVPMLLLLIMLVVSGNLLLIRGSDDEAWSILMVFTGTVVYPLMTVAAALLTYGLVFPGLPGRIHFGEPASSYVWPLVGMALARAASGMLFGTWLGFLGEAGKTHRPGQTAVEA